jgi:glycine cleavage system pyridoxal-binding protein P
MNFENKDVSGFLFQYPDTDGSIENIEEIIQSAKKNKVFLKLALNY